MTDAPARRRRGPSVRTKVLGSVLLMAAIGMATAEAASYVVQSRRLDARLDSALRQEIAEFRALDARGVDPATGTAFQGVEQLLATALARNVADENETFLALVDGRPFRVPVGDRPVRLEDEPALVATLGTLPGDAPVQLADAETAVGTVRYAAVQVVKPGSDTVGTYVVAYAADLERRVLVDITRTYAVVALVSLVLLGLVASFVVGRILRPLRLLREAAQRTAETDFGDPIPVRGSDEVSDLTRSFNAMIGRLRDAFEEQRTFIDDAGHELRTPVTIVRGHLELLDPADEAEVRETRTLLLDELDRTSRLVEDLVLLAKARRPDFVVHEPVDVALLTDEVLDKAVALGPRQWRVDGRADVELEGDRHRLTQALLQLADNAVRSTAPGATIAVGSSATDGEVRLWVRDDGPGVAERDRGRIFERFGRAQTGRGTEGSGLGLSIVCAIAEAHRGHVELASEPGHGATFTLVLPRAQEADR
ncbi:MAG: integral rane sensor signal transduction histidine kinase [Frankiales bacterium]|nr:integral rane sensor signal transduction histidine kinase [Frankiales bacterium]